MAQSNATAELSPCTLFVRGIPSSCSNETLSEVFSKAGPIKECFVVKYKNSGNVDKPCIGYVTYSSSNDAKSALHMENGFCIDNSKLKISFARRKISKKRKISEVNGEETKPNKTISEKQNKQLDTDKPIDVTDKTISISASGTDIPDDSYTVQISGLPALYSKDHVLSLWKKYGLRQPQSLLFPCEDFTDDVKKDSDNDEVKEAKDQLQTARFVVESKQAALKAYNKLSGKVVGKKKNYALKVTFLTPEGNFKAARKSRLIVRNVSFQCTEDDLKKAFDRYGTVTEVKIPTKPDGKKKGFAFVQFTHVFEATKAIKAMNLQEIKGRKVVIDWSLPKEKYKEMNETSEIKSNDQDSVPKEEEAEPKSGKTDDLSESNEDVSGESSSDSGLADDDEDDSDSDDDGDEDDSDGDGDEDDGDDGDVDVDELDNSEVESDDDEERDQEENPYSSSLSKVTKIKKKHNPKTSHDVHEGRTVFIQNLSYDTTEEQLSEELSEYGELQYAKIVLNRDTGMSKGCGFVQFKTKEDAQGCVNAIGGENGGRMLDGREIKVVFALSRGDTDKLLKEGKKKKSEKEDKRNLHLGREGLVRPGTQAAEGLSEIELKRREKIENAKRAKLKNPNVFVSTTRLCVHNLPKSVDDAKLRELFMNQFKNRQGVRITECRIMRDMKNLNEKGVGRPLGYAFVNFTKHEHALAALRGFNNNPDIFGPIKRPIVEFSLENKKALEIQEKRRKKFFSKQKLKDKLRDSSDRSEEEKSKKLGRRKRQNLKRKLDSSVVTPVPDKRQKMPDRGQSHRTKQQGPSGKPKITNANKNSAKQDERFPFQGSVSTTKSGKKLPLPTHAKPKIRQKNKGKILDQMRRSKKLNSKAAQRKVMQRYNEKRFGQQAPRKAKQDAIKHTAKPSKRKRNNEDANFNALVSKYTKALSNKLTKTKKSGEKWYE